MLSVAKKIKIICPEHGIFEQIPTNHLDKGRGCSKCNGGVLLTQEEFLERAKNIHNNKYDYSFVEYKNYQTLITIICPKHEKFKQSPQIHLGSHGCKKCCKSVSKPSQKWLDTINNPNIIREKVIHINGKRFNLDGLDPTTNTIFEFNGDFWHGNPDIFNPNDINKVCKKTFGELYRRTLEKKEILEKHGYKVISIWENDWNKIKNF